MSIVKVGSKYAAQTVGGRLVALRDTRAEAQRDLELHQRIVERARRRAATQTARAS